MRDRQRPDGRAGRPARHTSNNGAAPAAAGQQPGGTLYVVATPIGNLADITERARAVLAEVSAVACEDTRHTGALLSHLGIRRPLLSLHEHNEQQRLPEILSLLAAGESVALVSDAGTPLLSDPGFPLVRAVIAAGSPVVAVPGPSAVLAALVSSGLPPYPFTFCGFPPRRSGRRRTFFARFAGLDHSLVILESPHRLLATLEDAAAVLGDRPAAVCRELTKLHEETLRGTLSSVHDTLAERERVRGEVVLVIGGVPRSGDDERFTGAEESEEAAGDEPASEEGSG